MSLPRGGQRSEQNDRMKDCLASGDQRAGQPLYFLEKLANN